MIRTFSVQNYLSIKNKQELSFIAKSKNPIIVEEVADGTLIYKLGILFGANASGKSNMLIAINEIFRLLVKPKSDSSEEIEEYVPFVLTKDKPTEMSVSFYADNIRYDYKVIFNKKYILEEELYYYPNGSKALFYERKFVGENVQAYIKFGASLKIQLSTQNSIRSNILNNHSVLSICSKNNFKEDIITFKKLHNWIMSQYHEVNGDYHYERGSVEILKNASLDKRKHKLFRIMLNKADLNIEDFKNVTIDRKIPKELRERISKENIPDSAKEEILKPVVESIVFENKTHEGNFFVPFELQSRGTIRYIQILDALYDLISGNHVYYLDELGEDLHYDLLFYYLSVFLYNSENSQLIITSQEVQLLSQDIINDNRGIVWFVDKDKETASSEYSRADTYGLHKNLSLYNSYNVGRMGAKPELGSVFIDLDD